MIYHLLPEMEAFSTYRGGALSNTVANLIVHLDRSQNVVCQSADDTWGNVSDRILEIPQLCTYSRIWARGRIPVCITGMFFRRIFLPFMKRLNKGDIVWCHNQPFFAAALERTIHLKGAKLIYHSHDGRCAYAVRNAFRSFTPDACIFVSDALRKHWLKIVPGIKRSYVVYNAANERLFYPLSDKSSRQNTIPVVLYVGRLSHEKGAHILMSAIRILNERRVKVLCKVVGSSFSGGSKPTSYVRTLLKSCPANVQFKGYCSQTEIAEEFRSADIACCPSVWQEPFGKVNIEAMACGLPVVATRVGGIPEIAAEGGVILVEPNSAVQLADALQRLIEDKELRMKVGREGLQSFTHRFRWTVIFEQFQRVIDSLYPAKQEGE